MARLLLDHPPMRPRPHSDHDAGVATRRVVTTVLAVLTGVLAVPMTAQGAAAGDPHAFGPGEVLVYDVHYGPVHTGKARIAVGANRAMEGKQVWPIVVQARTNDVFSHVFPVRDQFVTLWQPKAAGSLGFDFHADENGRRRFTRMRLDPAKGRAVVERQVPGKPPHRADYQTGRADHDVASAVFWLRTRPLHVGDREQVRVFTGHRTWVLVAHVEGKETVKTPAGRYHTVRVRLETHFHGKLAARHDIVLWMTDDTAHVPVRAEAELVLGSVQADLSTYLPGLTE